MFKTAYIQLSPPEEIKTIIMGYIYKQKNKSLLKRFLAIKKFSVYYVIVSTLILSTLGTTYIFNQKTENSLNTQISQLNSTLDSFSYVLDTENSLL